MSESLIQVLMRRDDLSRKAARKLIFEAHNEVLEEGLDPDDVLANNFGLEPDYVFDLLEPHLMEEWYE